VSGFRPVADVRVDVEAGRVFEHGWQSWSPTTTYPVGATSHRPRVRYMDTMCWRSERPPPARGFQGEGLLAVDPGDGGPVRVFAGTGGPDSVPSIRASLRGDRLVVSADRDDGAVETLAPGSLDQALAGWADGFARRTGVPPLRPPPTVWCSWYVYASAVTQADLEENLAAIERHDLPIDVVQIDDGWQTEVGDWLIPCPQFGSLDALVAPVRDSGWRVGLWCAPFVVGADSRVAQEHPDWLVDGADAGHNWGQQLFALDVTHPGAASYLDEVFTRLQAAGVDYLKLDFLYAGALPGRRHTDMSALEAYRLGLRLIADAAGPDTFLLGSGAPILPSVGLVDAMRVAPDIDSRVEPVRGDMSRPSLRAASLSTRARAWQHGRFWINDPDCLLARPSMPQREHWAQLVERYGGLRASGDRIDQLDSWGLDTTRRLLSSVPPPTPWPPGH
jgi:alpha-galactosidase